ncbi:MAG TPA: luciferase family protein [Longimicrobium sp.]|nr:luciferase family protein [Longimicrobium sp.]
MDTDHQPGVGMMSTGTVRQRITDEVTAWPGVEAGTGSRGEFSFTYGRREIGHLHGDRVAHFGFPADVGAQLRAEGRVGPHPVAPNSVKMAARMMENDDDVRDVISMMRMNYDRLVARLGAGEAAESGSPVSQS